MVTYVDTRGGEADAGRASRAQGAGHALSADTSSAPLEAGLGAEARLPTEGSDLRDRGLQATMDPSCDGECGEQALVAPWPVAALSDTCGWTMQRR
eukprot:5202517-Alexandrium_andersonii.AAC.1